MYIVCLKIIYSMVVGQKMRRFCVGKSTSLWYQKFENPIINVTLATDVKFWCLKFQNGKIVCRSPEIQFSILSDNSEVLFHEPIKTNFQPLCLFSYVCRPRVSWEIMWMNKVRIEFLLGNLERVAIGPLTLYPCDQQCQNNYFPIHSLCIWCLNCMTHAMRQTLKASSNTD